MEAAAMEAISPSPPTMASTWHGTSGGSLPSTSSSAGRQGSARTAAASAHKVAWRILSRSIRRGGAIVTATWALAQISA